MKTIYAGNLPFSATDAEISDLFALYGPVQGVSRILDRQTGLPRGFAFIQMDDPDADRAIAALNGQLFGGRRIQVNEAQPLQERSGEYKDRPRRPRSYEGGSDNGHRPSYGDRPRRPRYYEGDPDNSGRPPYGDRSRRPRY